MTDLRKSTTLINYFEALERLEKGRPRVIQKGAKITNDAVALEAGRTKGSIKKSRTMFAPLIEAIAYAATNQKPPSVDLSGRIALLECARDKYRSLYEDAVARELSLLHEIFCLKRELSGLTGQKILPLRRTAEKSAE
jgi:hypothetical protein